MPTEMDAQTLADIMFAPKSAHTLLHTFTQLKQRLLECSV